MNRIKVAAEQEIWVDLRRSAQARRLSLRVSNLDGRVTLTVPRHVSEAVAVDFAQSKADWLHKHLANRAPLCLVKPGIKLPVEGKLRLVTIGQARTAKLFEETIEAPEARVAASIAVLLKSMARERLQAASERFATQVDRKINRVTLRDTRSRWGSCSEAGNLMYSWRLILAPSDVLTYVAAHEVAHLVEMNHSQAFWDVVADLCPNYAEPRKWLRQEGAGLHAFRFSSGD